ncbi:hypothetical protein JW868_01005 [Candidatus Woesearchaeota archaeon]|nr:hypothetical protein [Candidatus Woesearchaeota archaeon]
METRKLVKSGKTSFTVAVPINWVRRNKLQAGSEIQLTQTGEGDIVISTSSSNQPKKQETTSTLNIDGMNLDEVITRMQMAYLRQYNTIIIKSKEIAENSKHIISIVQNYIGLEIMEQGKDYIRVKNFYNLDNDTAPRSILKKMNVINSASINHLSTFFDKGFTKEDFIELLKFDRQNKKLSHLVDKSTLVLYENPMLMKRIQTNHLDLLRDSRYVRTQLRINSQFMGLGKTLVSLNNKDPEINRLEDQFKLMQKNFGHVVKCITNKDMTRTIYFLKFARKFKHQLDQTIDEMQNPQVVQAATALRTVHSYLRDMAFTMLV